MEYHYTCLRKTTIKGLIIPNVGREQLQLADITGGSENNTVTLENSKFLKMKVYIYLP